MNATLKDMTWAERVAVAPLLAAIIFIGVYPQPVLSRMEPAVDHLVAHIEAADPGFKIPAKARGHGTFVVPKDQVVAVLGASGPAPGGAGSLKTASAKRGAK
ncbi:MAG: hypothetical protein ACYCXN_11530 [Acidimicrobiales bacterium]